MKKLILSALFTGVLYAGDCVYTSSPEDFEAHWTAFKTPAKAGVTGRFKSLGLGKKLFSAKSIKEMLVGQDFNINTKSVWTRNAARDAKIIKYFFSDHVGGFAIKGKVKDMRRKKLILSITMNGVTNEVPMSYEETDSFFKAKGVIDVFDFNLSKSLKAINIACKSLHQGKTWNDVNLELKVNFKKNCK